MTYEYDDRFVLSLYEKMHKHLKHKRFIHSVGVAGTAASLAMKYGADLFKARIAGILHDCAKCYDDDELLILCRGNNIEVTPFEETHGFLLHAKYGAHMAREKYEIEDEDILSAIRWHTTGHENMTLLEKIVYISDYIEPSRNKAAGLDKIRDAAFNSDDIDISLAMIMKNTIEYLKSGEDSIDTTTMAAYDYYKKILTGKTE